MPVLRGDRSGQVGEQTGQCTVVWGRQPGSVSVVEGGPLEATDISLAMRGERTQVALPKRKHGDAQVIAQ